MKAFILLLLSLPLCTFAQKKITFEVKNAVSTEQLYLASNLSSWIPSDSVYRFKNQNGKLKLTIFAETGTNIQYKITRGSWETVECNKQGFPIANRELMVKNDTTIALEIAGWSDKIIKKPMQSKQLYSDTLFSEILKKDKAYWVYVPKDFDKTKKYPIIYLQDGQNLFDGSYTFNGQEWRVDETLDSLNEGFIAVGVASDGDRLSEYSPYPWKDGRNINGESYLRFLVEELVPLIEKQYLCNDQRSIGGSSMGALISLEAIFTYPKVFKNAALFSMAQANVLPDNSFILERVKNAVGDEKRRSVFIYYGKEEAKTLPQFSRDLFKIFQSKKRNKVRLFWNDFGRHEEKYWQNPFAEFINFIDETD